MWQELIEIFLILCIVYLRIYPIIADLSSVSEADLVELFREEMVGILDVGVGGDMFLLLRFGLVSAHQFIIELLYQVFSVAKNKL